MSDKVNIERAKERLIARKAELQSQVIPWPLVERESEQLDQILQLRENERVAQEISRRASRIDEIEAALQRIQDGSWGECVQCSQAISPRRMEFIPEAKLCLECQAQAEDQDYQSIQSIQSIVIGGVL